MIKAQPKTIFKMEIKDFNELTSLNSVFTVLKKNGLWIDRWTNGRTDGRIDEPTDGPMDQRTDGPTDLLIEMRGRILKR